MSVPKRTQTWSPNAAISASPDARRFQWIEGRSWEQIERSSDPFEDIQPTFVGSLRRRWIVLIGQGVENHPLKRSVLALARQMDLKFSKLLRTGGWPGIALCLAWSGIGCVGYGQRISIDVKKATTRLDGGDRGPVEIQLSSPAVIPIVTQVTIRAQPAFPGERRNSTNDVQVSGVVSTPAGASKPTFGGEFYATGLVADGSVCADNLGTPCTYSGTDNTASIQKAIDAAYAAGGGIVHLPAGTYNILIIPGAPRPGVGNQHHVAALTIPGSNITLEGAGSGRTTLSVWMQNADGSIKEPTATCPQNPDFNPSIGGYFVGYTVWRGSGIYIYGGTSSKPTSNVTIKDLRLTGNAAINRWGLNPAPWDQNLSLRSGSTCNAWDSSNKGIYLQNDDFTQGGPGWPHNPSYYPPGAYYYDDIKAENVRVDHFLGELVYAGNVTISRSSVQGSELDDSNGDGISVGGDWTIANNEIHDITCNGDEDTEDFVNGYVLTGQC